MQPKISFVDWQVHKRVKTGVKRLVEHYNRKELLDFLDSVDSRRKVHE